MAVLPTPGSPISTGLFLVRRDSTWITRRTSSSRPMTGSSLPLRASVGQVAGVALERLVAVLGVRVGDALVAADLAQRLQQAVARDAVALQGFGRRRLAVEQRQQQVLRRDVLVLQRSRLRAGPASGRRRASARLGGAPWVRGREARDVSTSRRDGRDVGAQLAEGRRNDTALLWSAGRPGGARWSPRGDRSSPPRVWAEVKASWAFTVN